MNAVIEKPVIPPVLLSYQQDWVADPADVAFWEKSRRIGASWCDASDSVLTSSAADGMDSLYIGYSEDMTREYIDDCAMWAKHFQVAASSMQEVVYEEKGDSIKAFRIDFTSGWKILALSSRPRSIRGKQGKVTIDEAAFHDDLPGLLKAALAMLIWGGRVRVLSSHNGEDNYFNQVLKDMRAGKLPYSHHKTTFDDALRAGLYERVKLIQGDRLKEKTEEEWRTKIYGQYGAAADEELDVIPSQGSGVYIQRTLLERCQDETVPVLRFSKPLEWVLNDNRISEAKNWIADVLKPVLDSIKGTGRTVLGQDFGRSGDLSVIWVLQQESPILWRTPFVLEMRRIPFDVQQLILFFIMDELPLLHHAKFDARGNGQSHAEAALQKYGVARVECVMASPTWYAVNFPPYKTAFEDRSLTIPKSEDIIADHRRVILDKGRPRMDDGRDKGSDGYDRHGDSAIAGLLAWAATRQEGQPAAGETVESDNSGFMPSSMAGRKRLTMNLRNRAH